MAFTSFALFSIEAPAIVDSILIGIVVAGEVVGANYSANVEGTAVEVVGITILEMVAKSLCLD